MATYYVQTDGSNANAGTATGAANAWKDPGYAAQQMGADDVCYVKSGTYNITTVTPGALGPVAFASTAVNCLMEGYETTPGDACPNDNFPVVRVNFSPGSAINIFQFTGSSSKTQVYHCMEADGNNASNTGRGFQGQYGIYEMAIRCVARDCSGIGFDDVVCVGCYATGNNSNGFNACDDAVFCLAYNNGGDGFQNCPRVVNCVSRGNASEGFNTSAAGRYINCVSYDDGSDGFELGATSTAVNCIAYGAGGYSFDTSADSVADTVLVNCADDGGTSGRTRSDNEILDTGAITLTADPFTNAANSDFSLNATAGGGALCADAGLAVYGQVARVDIGAVESTQAGGGGGTTVPQTLHPIGAGIQA